MKFNLPKVRNAKVNVVFERISAIKNSSGKQLSPFEKKWSLLTGTLSSLAFFLVLFAYPEPVQQLIAPFFSPIQAIQTVFDGKKEHITFGFMPGWSLAKYDDIAFESMDIIAFYDVGVSETGLDTDTNGYTFFRSAKTAAVFDEARQKNKKIFLTLSQVTNTGIAVILDNPKAQQRIISEAIHEVKETNIDGIVVDFEYTGNNGEYYRPKFTQFITDFTRQMHEEIPHAQVATALGSTLINNSFYDTKALATASDHVFMMAYSVALPEERTLAMSAPQYGYKEQEYWKDLNDHMQNFVNQLPAEKLVLETAWYGNGDNYPFYQSGKANAASTFTHNTMSTPLSEKTIDALVAQVPARARAAARKNIPHIAKALEAEGILNPNVLSYALATIEHETASTFEPIEEIKGRRSARRLGYEGGTNYFGRGFIQLTHLRNYKMIGERIGVGDELVRNPDLASSPEVAARVLAAFFKDNNIARLATNGSFVLARRPVNPDSHGYSIASLAWKYRDIWS